MTRPDKTVLGDRPVVEEVREYLGKWRGHWRQLAKELDVSFTWIQRVYNGGTDPSLGKAEKVLRHRDTHGDRPPEYTPWTIE